MLILAGKRIPQFFNVHFLFLTNQVEDLFDSIPLPFKYCSVPYANEPKIVRKKKRKYYVNQVITTVTKAAFKHAGFIQTTSRSKWNASWGKLYNKEDFNLCQCWQRPNHFLGSYLIGRKDQLHYRMKDLRKRIGKQAHFYPKSFLLPDESSNLQKSWKKCNLWIMKPSASSRGRGIKVVSSSERGIPKKAGIVQHYISRPLLILGRKFDIRLYALVTSVNPLRVYVHKNGLARFATHQYDPKMPSDRHMHLTNFSINRNDQQFVRNTTVESVQNSKWSLQFMQEYFDSNGVDSVALMSEIHRVVTGTLVAGMAAVGEHHSRFVIHHHMAFELYGIDIILDENLKPYVMEVNISPSLSGLDSKFDFDLKFEVMLDVLRTIRIVDCNPTYENPCPSLQLLEKEMRLSMANGRTSSVESGHVNPWSDPVFADYTIVRDTIEEKQRCGGFKRIYPAKKNFDFASKCFPTMKYQDIVLGKWIQMNKADRYQVLQKNLGKYKATLESIKAIAKPKKNGKIIHK